MSSWRPRSSVAAPPRPCAVEGCGGEAHARGLCSTHYGRVRYHREREERLARRRLERAIARLAGPPAGVITTSCGHCGTPATKDGHRDTWRDGGHRPFLIGEAA